MARNKKNPQQNSSSTTATTNNDDSDQLKLFKKLLEIGMPRCSVCLTSWFCDDPENKGTQFQKKNMDQYIEMKAQEFVQLPRCECTTSLITNPCVQHLDRLLIEFDDSNSNTIHANRKTNDMIRMKTMLNILLNNNNDDQSSSSSGDDGGNSVLSLNDIQTYRQKGMCRPCLPTFIKSISASTKNPIPVNNNKLKKTKHYHQKNYVTSKEQWK